MARILITGSAQGLGRAAATTLLDDGHQVVVHARDTNRAAALTDLVDRGAALVVGDLASPADPSPGRSGQPARPDGRHHPQRRRLRRHAIATQPRRASAGTGGQHPRPLPTDRADRETGPADLPHQRHARQRRRQPPRPRLDHPPLERHPGLLRQQTVRHRARPRHRPPLARRDQPRRRPRLGAHPHGRPIRHRRPRTRPPHPNLARHQRRPRRPRRQVWHHHRPATVAAAARPGFQDRLLEQLADSSHQLFGSISQRS